MEYIAIGNLCSVSSSKRIFAEQYVDEGVPFYRQKEILAKSRHQVIDDPIYISRDTYEKIKGKFGVPKEKDILLTAVGVTLGIPYLVSNEEFYFKDGNLIWLSDFDEKLNPEYLYYWLASKTGHDSIYMKAIGSAQPAITIDMIKRYKFFMPERRIQDVIVSTMSSYDEIMENNNKRIKILEKIVENLYKEWFIKLRIPGKKIVAKKAQSPKGWMPAQIEHMVIPEDWHFGELKELGEFVRGRNITAAQMEDGKVPVISAGLEPSGYHNKSNVKGESITISASGANAGFLKYNLSDIWAADCSYYQNDDYLWFVYSSLKYLQPVLSNLQCGAAQPHVYPKNINKLQIIIPTEDIIKMYCEIVKPIFEEIGVISKKTELMSKQKQLLLPRLMSGKLKI